MLGINSPDLNYKTLTIEYNRSGNGLFDEGVRYLSEAIVSNNCQLRELNIYVVGLTSDGAMQLAETLKSRNCKSRAIRCSFLPLS